MMRTARSLGVTQRTDDRRHRPFGVEAGADESLPEPFLDDDGRARDG